MARKVGWVGAVVIVVAACGGGAASSPGPALNASPAGPPQSSAESSAPTAAAGGGTPVETAPSPTPGVSGALFPTGVDASGAALAPGSIDPHYTLSSNSAQFPGPNAIVVPKRGPNWTVPGPGSQWDSAQPSAGAGDVVFDYTTTFTLSTDPTKASLTGVLACDDECTILLNGTQVDAAHVPAWHTKHTLAIPAGAPFVSGSNTLVFAVHNLGGVTGLEVYELTLCDGSAPCPAAPPPPTTTPPTPPTPPGPPLDCGGGSSPSSPVYTATFDAAGRPTTCTAFTTLPDRADFIAHCTRNRNCRQTCSCPTTPAPTGCCRVQTADGYSEACYYDVATSLVQRICPTTFFPSPPF
jgi:hypothetical protein